MVKKLEIQEVYLSAIMSLARRQHDVTWKAGDINYSDKIDKIYDKLDREHRCEFDEYDYCLKNDC